MAIRAIAATASSTRATNCFTWPRRRLSAGGRRRAP
jgi:hypothetical protein